jgi:biopolymer transport protein ExbB
MKMTRHAPLAFFASLLGILFFVQPAQAWFDKDWSFRKAIAVDGKAGGVDGDLKRFPMLVRLDSGQFSFKDAQAGGQDLRFVDQDDKTVLTYAIESYDAALGMAMVWVDLPELPTNGPRQIWMYYGNKKAQAVSSDAHVFEPSYRAVYHFAKAGPVVDATAYHNNASAITAITASAIGGGGVFDGTAGVTLPQSASLAGDPATGFTFEAWVHEKTAQANAIVYARRDGTNGLVVGLNQGVPFLEVNGKRADAAASIAADWAQLAVVGDGSKTVLYVNGQPSATVDAPVPALQSAAMLGADAPGGSGGPGFIGEIDEVRLSATARTPSYLAAEYGSQRAGATILAFGADEKASGIGFGYFGIIFRNITPDAWVVISVLVVMALLSWVVMWFKADYATRSARANQAFTKHFKELHNDLTGLEAALEKKGATGGIIEHAPLYRLYKVGMSEVHARGDLRGRALTEETVEAIRASLDAQQVEENQKLDSFMVLLTIAISGGPFIGLLGTVLGVMITFAAIAAAGDVNVNAIAPGVAAALLATVTGLFVAIPALFGYNYISTRNGDISAKMQVFADQFITRLAELQRNASMRLTAAE